MKQPNLAKWEYKPELEGLLFFASSIEEMLFHHTIDTYKAPALNTHTTIFELGFLGRRLINNKGNLTTLDYVIDELETRLHEDPAINGKKKKLFEHYISKINSLKIKPQEMVAVINSLASEIDLFYWDSILSLIQEIIQQPKEKHVSANLAAIFIAEAELRGFSREYIYNYSNRFFFDPAFLPKKIVQCSQIKDYLTIFSTQPQTWKVVFKGSSFFEKLNNIIAESKSPSISLSIVDDFPNDCPKKRFEFFNANPNFPKYISIEVGDRFKIKDPYGAREIAKGYLETITDIYSFLTHEEKFQVFNETYVLNTITKDVSVLDEPLHQMKCGVDRLNAEQIKAGFDFFIDLYSGKIFTHQTTDKLTKSFRFHKAALESRSLENQLLDLWAALEGLLPNPSNENARIVSYINYVIPSLVLSYTNKVFSDLSESLLREGGVIREKIDAIKNDLDPITYISSLIVCKEMEDSRKDIYAYLVTNPLLKNRIYQVHECFKSKKSILSTITYHKNKTSRHIKRIYSSRNQIVHNATALPYISTLVENLHSYLDTLTSEISKVAITSNSSLGISSILHNLEIKEVEYLKRLDGKDDVECETKNYRYFLFPDYDY